LSNGYFDCTVYNCTQIQEIYGNNTAISNDTAVSDNILTNLFFFSTGFHGALGLLFIILINLFFAGASSTTITSRISFALARDEAFPFGKHIAKISKVTDSPLYVCLLVFVVDCLILSLSFINQSAFFAITGLSTMFFQWSYAIPIFTRVTVRRNMIFPHDQGFALGWLSIPIGWCACVWLFVTGIFFFWPFNYPVNSQNMNYVPVVFGFIVLVALIYWIVYARNHFKGPPRQKNVSTYEKDE